MEVEISVMEVEISRAEVEVSVGKVEVSRAEIDVSAEKLDFPIPEIDCSTAEILPYFSGCSCRCSAIKNSIPAAITHAATNRAPR
jgi:aerobic-type carbon monoxide dehydrogenase small subunit (CoxS/CutS family)